MIRIESQQDAEKATLLRKLLDVALKAGGLPIAREVLMIDHEIVEEGKRWEAAQQKEVNLGNNPV